MQLSAAPKQTFCNGTPSLKKSTAAHVAACHCWRKISGFLFPFVFQGLCRELSLETCPSQLTTWKWSIWQTQRSFWSQANGENVGDVEVTVVINSILCSDNPFGYIKSIWFISRFYFTLRQWAHIFICILSSWSFFIAVFIPNQREKEWKVKWGW